MENNFIPATGGSGSPSGQRTAHGIGVDVAPALTQRDRLTCAFLPILAIPHILLVGGPVAFALSLGWHAQDGPRMNWGAGAGVLGAVAGVNTRSFRSRQGNPDTVADSA